MIKEKDEVQTKEDFCPPCLAAIPLAFAATSAGASKAIDDGTKNSVIVDVLWNVGIWVAAIVITLLSIWGSYMLITGRECKDCRA